MAKYTANQAVFAAKPVVDTANGAKGVAASSSFENRVLEKQNDYAAKLTPSTPWRNRAYITRNSSPEPPSSEFALGLWSLEPLVNTPWKDKKREIRYFSPEPPKAEPTEDTKRGRPDQSKAVLKIQDNIRQPLAKIDGNVPRGSKRPAGRQSPPRTRKSIRIARTTSKENIDPFVDLNPLVQNTAASAGANAAEAAYAQVYPHGHRLVNVDGSDFKCAFRAMIASLQALKDQGTIEFSLPDVQDLDSVLAEDLVVERLQTAENLGLDDMTDAFSVDLAALTIQTWVEKRHGLIVQMGYLVGGKKHLLSIKNDIQPDCVFFVYNTNSSTSTIQSRYNHFMGLCPLLESEQKDMPVPLELSDDEDGEQSDQDYVQPVIESDADDSEADDDVLDSEDEDEAGCVSDNAIDVEQLSGDQLRVLGEFLNETHDFVPSEWNNQFKRQLVEKVHAKLPHRLLNRCQTRGEARLRKIMNSILANTDKHPKGFYWSTKFFFDFLKIEKLDGKWVDICCGVVLSVVLDEFGVDDYSPATLIRAVRQLQELAPMEHCGGYSDHKQVNYLLSFFDESQETLRNYNGESRSCHVRWTAHERSIQNSNGQFYPAARQYPGSTKVIIADVSNFFGEMGFFYIFVLRMIEASCSILLRSQPRKAKQRGVSWYTQECLDLVLALEDDFQKTPSDDVHFSVPLNWEKLEGFNGAWPLAQPIFGMKWHKEEIAILRSTHEEAKKEYGKLFGKRHVVAEKAHKRLAEWKSKHKSGNTRLQRNLNAVKDKFAKLKLIFGPAKLPATERRCFECWYNYGGPNPRCCDQAQPQCNRCKGRSSVPCLLITKAEYDVELAHRTSERRCLACWKQRSRCDQVYPLCGKCKKYGVTGKNGSACDVYTAQEADAELAKRAAAAKTELRCADCWRDGRTTCNVTTATPLKPGYHPLCELCKRGTKTGVKKGCIAMTREEYEEETGKPARGFTSDRKFKTSLNRQHLPHQGNGKRKPNKKTDGKLKKAESDEDHDSDSDEDHYFESDEDHDSDSDEDHYFESDEDHYSESDDTTPIQYEQFYEDELWCQSRRATGGTCSDVPRQVQTSAEPQSYSDTERESKYKGWTVSINRPLTRDFLVETEQSAISASHKKRG